MPYFVYCGHDDPGQRDIRDRARELHRQFIRVPGPTADAWQVDL